MTDGVIQIAPNSTGAFIDTQFITNGSGQSVGRQTVTNGDPTNLAAIQTVRAGSSSSVATTDGAAIVLLRPDGGGSPGMDSSANAPTWPVIGANFSSGAPAPFTSWVLLATVAANQSRAKITVDNQSDTPILCLRDDGTAASGAAPVNATGFTLNPKASAGPEGGHYESPSFRGRMRVFGASSSQFVAISTD
jgi:hypothetical protein